jgi:hypothetical protein
MSTATAGCPPWCDRHEWARPHHLHRTTLLDRVDVGQVAVTTRPPGRAPGVSIHVRRYPGWTGEQLFALGDALISAGGLLEHIAETS